MNRPALSTLQNVQPVSTALFPQYHVLSPTGASSIAVDDVNKDGIDDIVFLEYVYDVYWIDGTGVSGVQPVVSGWFTVPVMGMDYIWTCDVDSDGFPDVVVAGDGGFMTRSVAWFRNVGGGLFDPTVRFVAANVTPLSGVGFLEVNDVVCVDWDDDGDTDIAVSSYFAPSLIVYLNSDSSATWTELDVLYNATGSGNPGSWRGITAYDCDSDGDDDIVLLGAALIAFENTGPALATRYTYIDGSDKYYGNVVNTGDANGDGILDLVVIAWNSYWNGGEDRLQVFLGTSTPFAFAPPLVLSNTIGSFAVLFFDTDNDGDVEVVTPFSGGLYVFDNLGGGQFQTPPVLAYSDWGLTPPVGYGTSGLIVGWDWSNGTYATAGAVTAMVMLETARCVRTVSAADGSDPRCLVDGTVHCRTITGAVLATASLPGAKVVITVLGAASMPPVSSIWRAPARPIVIRGASAGSPAVLTCGDVVTGQTMFCGANGGSLTLQDVVVHGCAGGVLHVVKGRVTLLRVVFHGSPGAATGEWLSAAAGATVTMTDVTVFPSAGVGTSRRAVVATDANVTMVRCTVTCLSAAATVGAGVNGSGGVVLLTTSPGGLSSLTIINSSFTGCGSVADGGVVSADAATVVVTGSVFTGNAAGGSGGAIAVTSSALTLTGCTFVNNSASASGGCVSSSVPVALTVSNASFVRCVAVELVDWLID